VFGYDNAGRVASEHWTNKDLIFGAGIDRSYTYTATGEIETASVFGNAQNPANGSKITFGYDSLGNLTTEDSSLSSMTVSRVWGPHSGPNATTFFSRGASNALATVFREFDTVGRLHKVSLNNQIQVATLQHEAGTGRIDYGTAGVSAVPQYDHRDRLLGVDVYQGQNRLASVHDGVGVDGIVRERQRQFGVASPLTDFYAVDDAGRLTDENNGITAAVGQPPSDLDDKSVRPYFDDPTARGNTFKSYSLDGLGNWLSRTNATGTSNATFTTVTGLNQYWQDPSGQTWSYVAGAASQVGSTGYQFDVLGRLSTATSRAAGTLAYTYDALGRRAFEQSTAGTTELVWDSDQIVALGAAGSASTFALRVTGEGSQQTLATAQEMGNGSLSYLHSGVDGSTFAATTDSGLREAYSYSAFGETSFFDGSGKSTSGSAIGNRFLYQGQFYDAPIAAYALRAREYLPSAGRFLSPDPTGIDGGENLYAYVLGKPLFLSDPYGLSPIRPSVGGDGLRNTWQWHLAAGYADPNSKVAIASRLPLPIAAPFAAMLHHEGRAWIAEWSGNHGEAVIQGGLAGLNLLDSGLEAFTLGRLPAGSVVLAASGEEAGRRTLVEEVDRLAERAEQVHDVLDDIAQAKRTTAVLATDEGVDVVGSGTRDLSPAQREALQSGEVAAKLAGEHAEVTVITHAQNTGLTPSTLASKWDICPTCQAFIEKAGGVLNDVRSAFWPKKF
jgi:RHS repeat-associated protein